MTDKWTPGPWDTGPYSAVVGYIITAQPDPKKNRIRVAGIGGPLDRTEVEVKATARLIAAAPDMAKAFDALLARLDDNPEISELIGTPEIEAARAALAKARGLT